MKAYKHIEESKKIVKTLHNEFLIMDNAKSRLRDLNVLINTINAFEEMLQDRYHSDFFDIMIYSRLFSTLNLDKGTNIDFSEFLLNFDQDFRLGKDYLKEKVVDFIHNKSIYKSIIDNSINEDKFNQWSKDREDIEASLDILVHQLKSKILWNKKWN